MRIHTALLGLALAAALNLHAARPREVTADVCVYCATPSGIFAAITVQQEGRSVVIVEPSRWVGGILGAGLKPVQDCPNDEAVGGMTRDLLRRLGAREDTSRMSYDELRQLTRSLSPADIREDFLALLTEHKIHILYEHRADRVRTVDHSITMAHFDLAPFSASGLPPKAPAAPDNLRVTSKVFIDASYDGELMARAGVSYRTGRESAAEFDEERAGVRPPVHLTPIDPFVEPGKPSSGLLSLVISDHGKPVGAAD